MALLRVVDLVDSLTAVLEDRVNDEAIDLDDFADP